MGAGIFEFVVEERSGGEGEGGRLVSSLRFHSSVWRFFAVGVAYSDFGGVLR